MNAFGLGYTARMLAVLAGFAVSSQPSAFAQAGPFGELPGAWSGEGLIEVEGGSEERIRCQANYIVKDDGNNLRQSLRCAGDSYRMDLKTNLTSRGGTVFGTWTEENQRINGTVEGRVGGGQFDITISTSSFEANLSLTTYGNTQSVVVTSNGKFKSANIRLARQ